MRSILGSTDCGVLHRPACQARWNLSRVLSESAALKASYSVTTFGAATTVVVALGACGVHLIK
jgi:hypothetical protein